MPLSKIERVERRRAKLRAAGLRPIQVWVPDTRTPGFAEECRRQSGLTPRQRNRREPGRRRGLGGCVLGVGHP